MNMEESFLHSKQNTEESVQDKQSGQTSMNVYIHRIFLHMEKMDDIIFFLHKYKTCWMQTLNEAGTKWNTGQVA